MITTNPAATRSPTTAQRNFRAHALRNRVGAAGWNLATTEAFNILQLNQWDVDRAFANWQNQRESTEEVLREGQTQGPTLPQNVGNEAIAYALIPEQERRGLITNLRNVIREGRGDSLTRAEAALWMHRRNFDLNEAINNYPGHRRLRRLLHERFDRLRPAAGPDERSDALAVLLNITRRGDWWSISEFLSSHNWDLPHSVAVWHETGIPPVTHPKDRAGRDPGYGRRRTWASHPLPMPCVLDTIVGDEAGGEWPAELDTFDQVDNNAKVEEEGDNAEDEGELEDEEEGEEKEQRVPKFRQSTPKSRGYIINDDPETAKVKCPDESKFVIEHIKDGKYYTHSFDHKAYHWPQLSNDIGPPNEQRRLFDWANQKDVGRLNAWFRQARQRITGSVLRRASQSFCREELDFLFNLFQDEFNDRLAANPSKSRDDLLPMKITEDRWTEWTEAFNREFVARQLPGSSEPREARSKLGLRTQTSRTPRLGETFQIKQEVPRRVQSSEEEVDTEDQSDAAEESVNESEEEVAEEPEPKKPGTQ